MRITLLHLLLLTRPAARLSADDWKPVRRAVLERDDYRCQIRRWYGPRCGRTIEPMTVDHIVPKYHGGSDDLDNLQAACKPCNRRKWTHPPSLWLVKRALYAGCVWTTLGAFGVLGWRALPAARTEADDGARWAVVVAADSRTVQVFATREDAERARAVFDGNRGQLTVKAVGE